MQDLLGQFNMWLDLGTEPMFVYHYGHLAQDRVAWNERGRMYPVEPAHSVAEAAMRAYQEGRVELFQRRPKRGGSIMYIALRRP